MPFSSGTFSLYSPGNPVVTGTTISSSWAINTLNDIATGLTTCVLKDGSQTITANIPMSSFKFTGLAAGSAAGDSLRYQQLFTTGTLTLLGSLAMSAGPINEAQGTTLAAATTMGIGAATGNYVKVSGTTAIVSFDSVQAGTRRIVEFDGALTFTHNATNLILPGAANITTAAGDVAEMVSEGSGNWRCTNYLAAAYRPKRPVLGTVAATTTGTAVTVSGIPSWVKKVSVLFAGVSTNGTSNPLVQIGSSGGIEATNYLGGGTITNGASGGGAANFTTGFGIPSGATANVLHGTMFLALQDSSTNTWVASLMMATSNTPFALVGGGSKAIAGVLDRISLTTVNGTDAFDAGSINIIYE